MTFIVVFSFGSTMAWLSSRAQRNKLSSIPHETSTIWLAVYYQFRYGITNDAKPSPSPNHCRPSQISHNKRITNSPITITQYTRFYSCISRNMSRAQFVLQKLKVQFISIRTTMDGTSEVWHYGWFFFCFFYFCFFIYLVAYGIQRLTSPRSIRLVIQRNDEYFSLLNCRRRRWSLRETLPKVILMRIMAMRKMCLVLVESVHADLASDGAQSRTTPS